MPLYSLTKIVAKYDKILVLHTDERRQKDRTNEIVGDDRSAGVKLVYMDQIDSSHFKTVLAKKASGEKNILCRHISKERKIYC
jgi:hypothetical protein